MLIKNISNRVNFVQGLNLPINMGEKYYVNMDTFNETGASLDRTFMATQGHYDPVTDTFEEASLHSIFTRTIDPGNQTTQIFGDAQDSGDADVLVGYGIDHVFDWPPFFLESGFIILDALYVKSFRWLSYRPVTEIDNGHKHGIIVAPDELFHMEIKTDNTTDDIVTKDYIACYGHMCPCGDFTVEYSFLALDVNTDPGGATTTINIPSQIPDIDVYDILVGIGSWDETTQTFNFENYRGRFHNLIVR